MYLEIDCENQKEVVETNRLIAKLRLKVVRECVSSAEQTSFSHVFWVEGTVESLYEVIKTWEDMPFEEAVALIEGDTRRFETQE